MQFDRISSKSNPTLMWAASLHEKKYRDRASAFLLEGKKLVTEALSLALPVTHVFIEEGKWDLYYSELVPFVSDKEGEAPRFYALSEACFRKISTEQAPQGVIAVIKHLDIFKSCIKIDVEDLSTTDSAVFLYSVRDPGNLGAILRSAAAFGISTVLLSADCADLYNPKTLRAAMGGLFRLRVITVEDCEGSVNALRACGRHVWAAELRKGAVSLTDLPLRKTDVFVIGNEGHGIAEDVSASCDGSVFIPISGGVESLNASVAASVLLWEQSRL